MSSVNQELAKISATVSASNKTISEVVSTYDNKISVASSNATNALDQIKVNSDLNVSLKTIGEIMDVTNEAFRYYSLSSAGAKQAFMAFGIKTVDNTYVFTPLTNVPPTAGTQLKDTKAIDALNLGNEYDVVQVVNGINCNVRYSPYFIPNENGGGNITLGPKGICKVAGFYMMAIPVTITPANFDEALNVMAYNIALINENLYDYQSKRTRLTDTLIVVNLDDNNKCYRALTPRYNTTFYYPDIGSFINPATSPYVAECLAGREYVWKFSPASIASKTNPTYVKAIPYYSGNKVIAILAGGFDAFVGELDITPINKAFAAAQNSVNQLLKAVNPDAESQFGVGTSASYFATPRILEKNYLTGVINDKTDLIRVFTTNSMISTGYDSSGSVIPGTGAGTVYPIPFGYLGNYVLNGRTYEGWFDYPKANSTDPLKRIYIIADPVIDSVNGVVGLYGISWSSSVHTIPNNPTQADLDSANATYIPNVKFRENALNQVKYAVGQFNELLKQLESNGGRHQTFTVWIKQLNTVNNNKLNYVSCLTSFRSEFSNLFRPATILNDPVLASALDKGETIIVNNRVVCGKVVNTKIVPLKDASGRNIGAIEYNRVIKGQYC